MVGSPELSVVPEEALVQAVKEAHDRMVDSEPKTAADWQWADAQFRASVVIAYRRYLRETSRVAE